MRPVSGGCAGPAPPESLSRSQPLGGPLPAAEMSLLQSLAPVQNWLGQELEKCGIDAMIYTRYVLSLLLHDSYDYDLQDQVRSASGAPAGSAPGAAASAWRGGRLRPGC